MSRLSRKSRPTAHLLIAQKALEFAQGRVRKNLRRDVGKGALQTSRASKSGDNASSIPKSLILMGVSRMASRSLPGALLVGGGFLAKRWVERRNSEAQAVEDAKDTPKK